MNEATSADDASTSYTESAPRCVSEGMQTLHPSAACRAVVGEVAHVAPPASRAA